MPDFVSHMNVMNVYHAMATPSEDVFFHVDSILLSKLFHGKCTSNVERQISDFFHLVSMTCQAETSISLNEIRSISAVSL